MTRADELRAMLTKARRYVNSAETLRQQRDYDSAISRLYYAMFYAAEASLFSIDLTFSSHRGVISAFAQHFVKTKKLSSETYQWLREGFEKRQVSDYEYLSLATDAQVVDLQSKARQFLEQIEVLLRQSGYTDSEPTTTEWT
ncbi:MAG: HEPN domain-containing protein [Chloroflexi bacterium]|nr:HEPN domain-containing protein [Chloroflexota bacterium]